MTKHFIIVLNLNYTLAGNIIATIYNHGGIRKLEEKQIFSMGIIHYRWQMITVIFAQYFNPLTPTAGLNPGQLHEKRASVRDCINLHTIHGCFHKILLVTTTPVFHNPSDWLQPLLLVTTTHFGQNQSSCQALVQSQALSSKSIDYRINRSPFLCSISLPDLA